MLLIAIDPGASGGIAVYNYDNKYTAVLKMPDTPKDIYEVLRGIRNITTVIGEIQCRAIVEKVGFHVQGNNASSSCKFARHCGQLEMALIAAGIPFEEVTPQKWMKPMTLPKDKTARKNAIKDAMQRRYPDIKVTLWNADALGILTWALDNNKHIG